MYEHLSKEKLETLCSTPKRSERFKSVVRQRGAVVSLLNSNLSYTATPKLGYRSF